MSLRFPTLVFDIETLTDLKAGAHLHHLDLPEADVEQALTKIRRQESGSDFQRLPLHEIVCISGLWIDEKGFRLFSFSREQNTEAEMLAKFFSIFEKKQPTLVRWNGSQYHGLSAPSLFDQGEIDQQKRFNNYQNRYHHRHVDLMDVMAMFNGRNFQKLDDIASFLGFPGKRGESGYHVPKYVQTQQWLKLTSYCEGDVLNTWLVYLRWLLLKGQLSQQDHQQWLQATIDYLHTQTQQTEFLQVWRQTSQYTVFTAHTFAAKN